MCAVTCRLACRGRGCRRPRPAQVRPGVSVFSVGHGLTESFALSHWYLSVMEQRSPEEGTSWAALRQSSCDRDRSEGAQTTSLALGAQLVTTTQGSVHVLFRLSAPCDLGQSTCPRHGGDNYTSVTQCPRGECLGMAAPSPGVVTARASLLCPLQPRVTEGQHGGPVLSPHPQLCPVRMGVTCPWVCMALVSPRPELCLLCDASPVGPDPVSTLVLHRDEDCNTRGLMVTPGQPCHCCSDAVTGSEKQPYVAFEKEAFYPQTCFSQGPAPLIF